MSNLGVSLFGDDLLVVVDLCADYIWSGTEHIPPKGYRVRGMRILVVDDQFDSRWGIADWLMASIEPVAVESAASAAEALQLIEERKPDVILATHATPEGEALELAQRLKARPAAPVVVVLTERSDAQLEAACEAAGVDFCVEKRHLQARLLGFLRQRFSLRPARP